MHTRYFLHWEFGAADSVYGHKLTVESKIYTLIIVITCIITIINNDKNFLSWINKNFLSWINLGSCIIFHVCFTLANSHKHF